jgi:hypothetical protein
MNHDQLCLRTVFEKAGLETHFSAGWNYNCTPATTDLRKTKGMTVAGA